MSDNPRPADPGPTDNPVVRDGKRLRLVTAVWAVLMAVAVVMIILMLRS